ncbi:MAG: ADP-ribosylation factor-like protein [Promethearchaeota archaeon]
MKKIFGGLTISKQNTDTDTKPYSKEFEKTLKISAEGTGTPNIIDKILFTGLDNGGKTTIIKVLQKEYSEIAMLKPTKNAQRRIFNFLGKSISEWDLGGQDRYRIAFLKEPGKFFDNTAACIYTIDIQDQNRFQESLSYFRDVLETFKGLEISPYIFIFFHKHDPEYQKSQGPHLTGIVSELKEEIRKIVSEEFEVVFMKTTIYDLWSIISAFSQILLRLYPQSELLDKTILEFAERIKADAAIILDENSLVIGQHFVSEKSKEILAGSTPYFLTLSDSLDRNSNGDHAMIIQRGDYLFYVDQFEIKGKGWMYLLLMKPLNIEKTFNKEKVASFIQILESIL